MTTPSPPRSTAEPPPLPASRAWAWSRRRHTAKLLLDLLLVQPFLALARGGEYRRFLVGRMGGRTQPAGRGGLWIQAPAAGEIRLAASLLRTLPESLPVVITTYFGNGNSQRLAREAFGDRVALAYLPYPLEPALLRFRRHFAPRAYLQIESRGWPLLPASLHAPRIPLTLVNAYVAERQRRQLERPLLRPLLTRLSAVGAQSEEDRERLVELGVPRERVAVTGNLKFELPEPEPIPELETRLRSLAGGRPILVAGSVEPGDESLAVLEAFGDLGGGAHALLLLAPRGPKVAGEVETLARREGYETVRRTALPDSGRPDVVLLDSLGELARLYRLATAAFVGATLVPRGGHNPLEAARFGVPVAVGPSMQHFESIATLFDRAAAWRRVGDASELAAVWKSWLDDPAAARDVGERGSRLIEENRGALQRSLELLEPVLEGVGLV